VLTLFPIENIGGKHDVFFPYPPCEEIYEQMKNCQENEALWSWLMVMSGPHNFEKFSNLIYILPYLCDLYHEKIADLIEDSYIKNIRKRGRVMLIVFLNEYLVRKYDILIFYLHVFLLIVMTFDFMCLT